MVLQRAAAATGHGTFHTWDYNYLLCYKIMRIFLKNHQISLEIRPIQVYRGLKTRNTEMKDPSDLSFLRELLFWTQVLPSSTPMSAHLANMALLPCVVLHQPTSTKSNLPTWVGKAGKDGVFC